MHESQIKNIIHKELQEQEDRRQHAGCPVTKGCVKGKKMDAFIDGTYRSDKNDIREYIKKQDGINEKLSTKFTEAILLLQDVLNRVDSALKGTERAEKGVEKLDKRYDRRIRFVENALWGIAAGIVLMCIGTVWSTFHVSSSVGKINSVDIENQLRTEAFMAVLATHVSGTNAEQIIKEHQEILKNNNNNKKKKEKIKHEEIISLLKGEIKP